MKPSDYKISLDIHELQSQYSLPMKKEDTARVVYITLREGGVPYEIGADCFAVLSGRKPDGTVLENNCVISGNTIIYAITPQTTSASGRVDCEIKLYGVDNSLICSARFSIIVDERAVGDDEVESTSEFSALTNLYTEAREAENERVISEQARVDNENKRVSNFSNIMKQGENALKEVNEATDFVNDIANTLKTKLDNGELKGEKGDKGDTPTIDQEYDPKSENAQSGVAVAEAVSKKIEFVDNSPNSILELQHDNGAVNLNVKYPIATNPLLDEIAYENKSYRDIFITNNLIPIGNFENDISSDFDISYGSPEITTETYNSGSQSLKCFGSISNHIHTHFNFTDNLTTLYSGCIVKVDRYTSGKIGTQIARGITHEAVFKDMTDGFERASVIVDLAGSIDGNFDYYIGSFSNANLDGYVDDAVLIDLSMFNTPPTKQQMDLIYDEYLKRIKGVSYKLSVAEEQEETEEVTYTDSECVSAFISKVNEKATELGMSNSVFNVPSGAGVDNSSTARDLVKLLISASGYNELARVWGKPSKTIYTKNGLPTQHDFTSNMYANMNTDEGTQSDGKSDYYFLGGKTGTWISTGVITYNFGAICKVNDKLVAGVVMGASNDANKYKAINELFDIAKQVIENPDIDKSTLSVTNAPCVCCCVVPEYNVFNYENYPFEYLFEQNADTVKVPASITKIITSMVMLDYVKELNETITFKDSDKDIGGSGNMFSDGDIITYKDSLYAMMLPSSNMTAHCVARNVGKKILELG